MAPSCRSLESLDIAAEYDPSSVYTTFTRIKVLLMQGAASQALSLLQPLMACEGASLEYLRVGNCIAHTGVSSKVGIGIVHTSGMIQSGHQHYTDRWFHPKW